MKIRSSIRLLRILGRRALLPRANNSPARFTSSCVGCPNSADTSARSSSREEDLAELSAEFGVHPTMISNWKQELMKRAGELFARGSKAPAVEDAQKVIDDLHRKIGQLQVERDFLAGQPAISRVLRGGR